MIERLYIDNYKCFTNFECRLDAMQLVLGDNGSGKTFIFDVLATLRDFITQGVHTSDAFPYKTLTAWDARPVQTFELGVAGDGGRYLYRLVIEHDQRSQKSAVQSEEVQLDGTLLYQFDGHDLRVFRDDSPVVFTMSFDGSRSLISGLRDEPKSQRLSRFRHRMERVFVFSPDPVRMTAVSKKEVPRPDRQLHDLASSMRHLWQQRADFGNTMLTSLKEVIDGLANLRLERLSETIRELDFEFRFGEDANLASARSFHLAFDELSDGQRMLVALYTILLAAVNKDTTVCLDEPDNFVSLRELQPWLTELRDRVQERGGQCLLISHHPEFINYLAAKHGIVFSRDESGPAAPRPSSGRGTKPFCRRNSLCGDGNRSCPRKRECESTFSLRTRASNALSATSWRISVSTDVRRMSTPTQSGRMPSSG